MRRKQLLLMRSHLEKAVRCTGTGKHRELNRPQSLPLVNHTKALPEEITEKVISVEPSAHIADNIPEVTKKNRRK